MSNNRFIPDSKNQEEEQLQPMFERDTRYKYKKSIDLMELLKKMPNVRSVNEFFELFRTYRIQFSVLSGAISMAVLAAIIFNFLPGNPIAPINVEASELSLEAVQKDSLGVAGDSEYILKSDKDLDLDQVKSNITVEPKFDFDVEKISGKEFKIIPKTTLDPQQIYKFTVNLSNQKASPSWAFQISDKFKLLKTFPSDKTRTVPTNSVIQLIFNTSQANNPTEFFEINPKVEGTFEKKFNNWTFKPSANLKPATIYTVTLKPGLTANDSSESISETNTFQFETSLENLDNSSWATFSQDTYEFSEQEKPYFRLNTNIKNLNLSLFKYSNQEDFAKDLILKKSNYLFWAEYSGLANVLDVSKMQKIADYQTSAVTDEIASVELPNALEKGFYLIQYQTSGFTTQALVQVTNISGFVQNSNQSSLIWTMDKVTKQPVNSAKVSVLNQDISGNTDENGLVELKYNNNLKRTAYLIEKDGNTLYLPIPDTIMAEGAGTNFNGYWSHIYVDKPIYKPTDKINYYVFLAPRKGTVSDNIKIRLSSFSLNGQFAVDPVIISEKKISLDRNTVTGSFEFTGLKPDIYMLEILVDDLIVNQKDIVIKDYVLPSYEIRLETDKFAYIKGEKAVLTGYARTFDGVAVPNLELEGFFDTSSFFEKISFKTDENGRFSSQFDTNSFFTNSSTEPLMVNYVNLSVTPKNQEEADIEGRIQMVIFNDAGHLEVKSEFKNGNIETKGSLKNFDLSDINKGQEILPENYVGTGIANREININIQELEWKKEVVGTVFDPISRTMQEQIRYKQELRNVTEKTVKTDNEGNFSLTQPNADSSKLYSINTTLYGANGLPIYSVLSGVQGIGFPNTDPINKLGITNIDDPKFDKTYELYEDINIKVFKGEEFYKANGEKFLYIINQNGIKNYYLSDKTDLNLKFEADFVPNVFVNMAYYDGQNFYYSNNELILRFNPESKRLKFEVSTDKTSYKPRDEVSFNLKATDLNGKPVETLVNISVIDQALLSMEENEIDILKNLYKLVPTGSFGVYISHRDIPRLIGGAGGSGGNRNQFSEIPFFQTVKTDANGQVNVKFKLPDNLTTWSIGYRAVTSDLFAGEGSLKIISTIPLQGQILANESYLKSDKPIVKIRALSDEINQNEVVNFELKSEKLNFSKTGTTNIGKLENVALPALSGDNFDLTLSVSAKGLDDTLTKQIRLINSKVDIQTVSVLDLNNKQNWPTLDSSATLIIQNKNRNEYYQLLAKIAGENGGRLDQKLSKELALSILNTEFEEQNSIPNQDYLPYQKANGGLGIFPYAETDSNLQLAVSLVAPDQIDKSKLSSYLRTELQNENLPRLEKIRILTTLSALKEPVLDEIETANKLGDLTVEERIYLGLANSLFGNTQKAREFYNQLIAENVQKDATESSLSLTTEEDLEILNNVMMAFAGSLNDVNGSGFFNYLKNRTSNRNIFSLWQIYFIQNDLKQLADQDLEFEYTFDGQTRTQKLQKKSQLKLKVDNQKLQDLNLKAINGDIGLTLIRQTPISQKVTAPVGLEISRKYFVNGIETNRFNTGDYVKVELSFKLPTDSNNGCYNITDNLPAGLRVASNYTLYQKTELNERLYPYNLEADKVEFCLFKGDTRTKVSYFARVIGSGEFVAEPAVIQSVLNPENLNISSGQTIIIQ